VQVAIRADASLRMGSGHAVRCLTLAEGLRSRGAKVSFLCQRLPGHPGDRIEALGYPVRLLPAQEDWRQDAANAAAALAAMRLAPDWLLVDHYALDARWETALRPHAARCMVIDDLANRPHDCDLLLDQVSTRDAQRYAGLLPERCATLFGGRYALLRPEFAAARASAGFPPTFANNGLAHLFFGTSDEPGHTLRFAGLLLEHFPGLRLKVAVGESFVHPERLESLAARSAARLQWQRGVADMAAHMRGCALAVGTPGMSTWERACMGLPAAHLTNSDSQTEILGALKRDGFCDWLGRAETITDADFVAGMAAFLGDEARLERMRRTGLQQVDGRGVERVVERMLEAA
jgi:UDP-2,4-diacetamido-2,4,6-trideoxy-beta-L-altropyranose hydrolase